MKLGEQTNPTYINQQFVNPFGSSVVFPPLIVQSYTASYNNSYDGLTGTMIYGMSGTTGHQGRDAGVPGVREQWPHQPSSNDATDGALH
ncbi:hypothetical protein A9O66_37180 (plasmid) [Paraburkholderia caribensis]|uniref:Uncharacterized protein n=1 Tax=Paraburkholderia caribensis TaxID=75105 RepID=A0A9Q6SB09_9BURK|nr:hypothetical protein A9O66_37180 [Paraburkholderia caribensis]